MKIYQHGKGLKIILYIWSIVLFKYHIYKLLFKCSNFAWFWMINHPFPNQTNTHGQSMLIIIEHPLSYGFEGLSVLIMWEKDKLIKDNQTPASIIKSNVSGIDAKSICI